MGKITINCTECSWQTFVQPTEDEQPYFCKECGERVEIDKECKEIVREESNSMFPSKE